MPGTSPGMTTSLLPVTRIGNHAARHQPVPDEQHHQRADGRGDEAGALIRAVMADGLADKGREERAGDAEHGGQDESGRIVWARRKQSRDDPRDEADDDDPENPAHCRPPFPTMLKSQMAGVAKRRRSRNQSGPATSLSVGSRPSGVR